METKQKWVKPVLIVVGRGKPEERVLTDCQNSKAGWLASGAFCTTTSVSCKRKGTP